MRVTGFRPWLPLAAAAQIALTGCAIRHDMARERPAGWCPRRDESAEYRFSPPGVDRSDGPEVTWYSHPSAEDRESNSAWCEAVGPPTVIPTPHTTLLAVPQDTLAFVAWNTWVGGGDLKEFLRVELGLVCGEDGPLPQSGFKPFVLLLQETYQRSTLVPRVPPDAPVPWRVGALERPAGGTDVVEVAQACGLALAYVPSARNGPESDGAYGEDKGNALLSSLPLREVVAVELPFEAGRKVAVGAEIPLPDGDGAIVAVSIHLDVASTLARTLKTGNRTRERQVAGLLEALELQGWGAGPSVVGGDFNTWSSRDASLKLMLRTFSDSPPVTGETSRGPFPADHLFFRADNGGEFSLVPSSYRTVRDGHGSDHHARIFRIAVQRKSGVPGAGVGEELGGARSGSLVDPDPEPPDAVSPTLVGGGSAPGLFSRHPGRSWAHPGPGGVGNAPSGSELSPPCSNALFMLTGPWRFHVWL